MSEKFNELIELIISEENDQAKELFHEIIVDKSRSIYESLIDEDEVVDEDDEDLEESDFDEELGGDAAEDMIDDISADEEGLALEDEHEDEEMEDRVVDLEDALDELKAEFEQLMGGDDEGEEEMDMDMEPEMDDMEMDMEPEEEEEEEMDETFVREYTEKVAAPSNSEEGEKASGPVGNAKSKPHNGEAKAAMSPGTAETGMTPPKAAKQTKVAGNVNAKQSKV
tara:strand:+ start:489 stop:1163 length:675 start_codon:yes stop_codon:yes gene_type:complete